MSVVSIWVQPREQNLVVPCSRSHLRPQMAILKMKYRVPPSLYNRPHVKAGSSIDLGVWGNLKVAFITNFQEML